MTPIQTARAAEQALGELLDALEASDPPPWSDDDGELVDANGGVVAVGVVWPTRQALVLLPLALAGHRDTLREMLDEHDTATADDDEMWRCTCGEETGWPQCVAVTAWLRRNAPLVAALVPEPTP